MFLRALSFIQKGKYDKAKSVLKNITNEDGNVFQESKVLLASINDPSKTKKANEMAMSGFSYLYRSNTQHMMILLFSKGDVDVTYLKTLISDFHRTSIANEVFEISALLLGSDKHLLMIKSFASIQESMDYYDLFLNDPSLIRTLNTTEYKLMSISFDNFQEFYKNQDDLGYYNFFKKNYLTIN